MLLMVFLEQKQSKDNKTTTLELKIFQYNVFLYPKSMT
jgi:hypothetical protein